MNHKVFGKKLSRQTNERKRLRYGLVRDLILRGSVKTTQAKAVSVRSLFERIITQAKRHTASDYREIRKVISDKKIFTKLTEEIAPSLKDRNSGYTRILHLGVRRGDNAEIVKMEILSSEIKFKEKEDIKKITPVLEITPKSKDGKKSQKKTIRSIRKNPDEIMDGKSLKKRGRPKKTE